MIRERNEAQEGDVSCAMSVTSEGRVIPAAYLLVLKRFFAVKKSF